MKSHIPACCLGAGSPSATVTRSALDSISMYAIAGWSHGMDRPLMKQPGNDLAAPPLKVRAMAVAGEP